MYQNGAKRLQNSSEHDYQIQIYPVIVPKNFDQRYKHKIQILKTERHKNQIGICSAEAQQEKTNDKKVIEKSFKMWNSMLSW